MTRFSTQWLGQIIVIIGCSTLAACGESNPLSKPQPSPAAPAGNATTSTPQVAEQPNPAGGPQADTASSTLACENYQATGMPLFGDLHVHTSLSFDAAANSTGATPADAHRYAQGEAIPFFPLDAQGKPVGTAQIDRPLDFLAVTDHGEFLGERALCSTPGSPAFDSATCQAFRASQRQGMMLLATTITTEAPSRIADICGADGARCPEFAEGPWGEIQEAANSANKPCEFTSFVGYEYTGTPGTSNYHRNVIFRNSKVPAAPVSYVDAPIDSQLWRQLDAVCSAANGCDYLTIPHNTNLANGRMAPYRKLPDTLSAKQDYARKRLEREPVMEIFQHKGNSECINGLSSIFGAPDELCNIEAVRRMGEDKAYATRQMVDGELVVGETSEVTTECEPNTTGANGMLGAGCVHPTDFQRSALLVGMAEQQRIGANPIKLGVIGSTDTHSANPGGVLESAWGGAVTGEADPAQRLEKGLLTSGIDGNPGGLAGVWAPENTREAIFEALLRREVFGTSGPRIVPRLIAGWDLADDLCKDPERDSKALAVGVPMGGDLTAPAEAEAAVGVKIAPRFLAHASKDANSRDLAELQLIKGWVASNGELHTKVVPLAEAAGSASLCRVYTDPEFDAAVPAYYYLRVVEQPSPRWHTYDCAQIPVEEQPAVCTNGAYPDQTREMAWTSPIWYQPG